ncbi:MAG: c-type cytochrome [Leptospiraceae bacterium]|nr:c-type cytochrome [Leptospiraceae bacterium]
MLRQAGGVFVCLLFYCKPAVKTLELRSPKAQHKLTLHELRRFGDKEITIDDYYFKKPMHYRAIPLAPLLRATAPPQYDEILFHCADGYVAYAPRSALEDGKLDNFFLAYGEGGDSFRSEIVQGKTAISPEPFYVVSSRLSDHDVLSWPYALVAVEFAYFQEKFPGLLPEKIAKDPTLYSGFMLFRKECLRCHSLNLQGGDLGPELNIPRNITEYRTQTFLEQFIRNASAFRAQSKMPEFNHLKTQEIRSIIAYLRAMAKYKQRPLQH